MHKTQLLASFLCVATFAFAADASPIIGSVSGSGNITLTPTSGPVLLAGLNIESAAGLLTPVASPDPFDFIVSNRPTAVVLGNLGSFYTLDTVLVTSVVYQGDPTSGDLTLEYGDASFQVVPIPIQTTAAVPEPGSIAIWFSLIGFAGWSVWRRKSDIG